MSIQRLCTDNPCESSLAGFELTIQSPSQYHLMNQHTGYNIQDTYRIAQTLDEPWMNIRDVLHHLSLGTNCRIRSRLIGDCSEEDYRIIDPRHHPNGSVLIDILEFHLFHIPREGKSFPSAESYKNLVWGRS